MVLIVLTLTCALGAAGLACTYNLTKQKIAASLTEQEEEMGRKVLPPFKGILSGKTISTAQGNHRFFIATERNHIIGIATVMNAKGYGGDVSVMVGMLPDGTIYAVELLAHQETPGLGTKAGTKEFKSQFTGKKITSPEHLLTVVKKGEPSASDTLAIHAITAATITSRAFTNAVNNAVHLYLEHKKEF